MQWLSGIAASLLGGQCIAGVAQDCELGGRYLALAQQRLASYQSDEAMGFLKQAVSVCPNYAVYEQLAELAARSPDDSDQRQAVDAFVEAHALASSDAERARTLYQYASLLQRHGDPGNAYPLIKEAQSLEPGSAEIAALAQTVEQQVAHPTQEHIVRGLSDSLFQPLRVVRRSNDASKTPDRSRLGGAGAGAGPSVPIPINFDTGSTRADEATRRNIAVLAHALVDPSMNGRRFLFIGHADERGDEGSNLVLSRQRAEAIYDDVVLIEPSLNGRIDVTGRGESDPIDPNHDERAYRANRRLQVLLQ
jgi:outer membrane protein OmpA-like peptidoglycan-associated protein